VDPSGRFAYVVSIGGFIPGTVSLYAINPTTGALNSIGASVAAGTNPDSVAVDPSGRFAYVVNQSSNDISMYTIDSITGALTPAGTIAAGTAPASVAIAGTIQ